MIKLACCTRIDYTKLNYSLLWYKLDMLLIHCDTHVCIHTWPYAEAKETLLAVVVVTQAGCH